VQRAEGRVCAGFPLSRSRPWQAKYPAAIMTNQLERKGSVGQTMLGGPMTAAAKPATNQQRGDRAIEVRVAAKLENLAVLRTLVGAVGTFEDLDFDAVADLRLAVDEVCTRLIRSAIPDATLAVVVDPRDDELVVEASTTCDNYDVVTPGSFSWHVLTSLTDDVQTVAGLRTAASSVSR
jgi:serine/threonine-protein kinase RsbW